MINIAKVLYIQYKFLQDLQFTKTGYQLNDEF